MEIYNVGPDSLADYELKALLETGEGYKWMVYWYESGCYDGNGEIVALGNDGNIYAGGLGHCSCYGPCDDGFAYSSQMSVAEFFRDKDSIFDYDCKEAIKKKVKSLLRRKK